jgi:hypothetical protein
MFTKRNPKRKIDINGAEIKFLARLITNPGLKAGGKKSKNISVGFSPNKKHVMMRSLKDTDGKVGGLKPAGFLHNHLTPA